MACDEKGVALGPAALIEALSSNGKCVYRARPAEEIARTLALAYGPSPPTTWRGVCAASTSPPARSRGDLAKAGIATVLLKLPPLTTESFAKLAQEPTLRKYSPDQPRDERGDQPGFKDHPEEFKIYPRTLDRTSWQEGFITVAEAMPPKE